VSETEDTLAFVIQQRKEWGEILTGFETQNKYVICNEDGDTLFLAAEESGFLLRNFLKSLRPFTLRIMTADQQVVVRVERPFRFYFHKIEVYDGAGNPLGSVQRRWSWMRRVYSVLNADGQEIYDLFGPVLHPWTFEIRQDGRQIGKITKKWSGLLKETFTDADNFGMTVPPSMEVSHQSLLLGAVFLIDFVHFERSQN